MKKIILGSVLCLSVLLTTGCGKDPQVIQIKDSKGELQTITLSETDDKEVVQNVIDYANQANYVDITTIKLKTNVNGDLSLDDGSQLGIKGRAYFNVDTAFQTGPKGFDLDVSAVLNVDKSLIGASKNLYFSVRAGATCDYLLDTSRIPASEIYAFYSVETQDIDNFVKFKISLENLMKYIELVTEKNDDTLDGILDQYLPSNPSDYEDMTLDEFYQKLNNSKVSISEVNSDNICILFSLSYKDIVKLGDGNIADFASRLDMSKTLDYRIYVNTASGRLKGASFELTDKDFVKLFLTSVSAPDDFIKKIKLSMSFNIEYNGEVSWNSISDNQKWYYPEIPAPTKEEKQDEIYQPDTYSAL